MAEPQLDLLSWYPRGSTIDLDRDKPRLSRQMQLVWDRINDGAWFSLASVSKETGAPEASVSARLRDFRALGFTIERQFITRGLHLYRMVKP